MALSKYEVARLTDIAGAGNATTDPLDLRAYEYDAALERGEPEIVLFPESTQAVCELLRFCNEKRIPVTPRGSGTCLSGGPVPLHGGAVLEFSRMDKLLSVDLENQRAVCQAGYLNFDFIEELAKYGHLYAPDPSSQRVCTMGGNAAENSGGPHCLKYGVTTNHITGLTVVLADGEVMELGGEALEAPGYDLRGVVIGSEGTLGAVTEMTCRIIPLPEKIVTMLAIFDSLIAAGEAVSGIIASGMIPATLEMMDRDVIRAVEEAVHAGYPLDAEAVLIIELDGLAAGMDEQVRQITDVCTRHGALRFQVAGSEEERELLWKGRKGAFGAVARIAPNKMVTDIAVPRTELPRILAECKAIGKRHGLDVGNVFHAGDGNLHPQLLFDDRNPGELERVKAADKEIAKLAVEAGGVLTGEHGIGCQKTYAMPLMCAAQDLALMRALKRIFDPKGTLNPGKVLPDETEGEQALKPLVFEGDAPGPGEFAPASYEEAAAVLAEASRLGLKTVPLGGRSKAQPPDGAMLLTSRGLRAIVDYDWENLTVTAQAGMTVAELQATLAEHGQFAPITAPFPERATLGGVIAANSNGPMRYGYGEVRDSLLGVRLATCTGQVMNSGSKTVKNVTGYDVKRLLVGTHGSLGMIVEATFLTLPLPPAEEALVARLESLDAARRLAQEVRTSHLLPSAIELVNGALWDAAAERMGLQAGGGWRMLFSLRGHADDVEEMREGITAMLDGTATPRVLDREAAATLWSHIPEPSRLVEGEYCAYKLVAGPAAAADMVAAAIEHAPDALVRASMGSGAVHVLVPGTAAETARALSETALRVGWWLSAGAPAGGGAELMECPDPDRISTGIKAELDPAGILPGIPC